VTALVLALAGVPHITSARADGDPASDVLVAAPPIFLSADSGATYAEKETIADQLNRAARRGHTLRVAVISHRDDLGSVTGYWGDPAAYAQFLGQELPLNYRGQLLVVMPSGFGVSRQGRLRRTAVTGLAPRAGHLIEATEQAVARLTGVAPAGSVVVPASSVASPASGAGWWIATALAITLVAAAWTASLRARSLRSREVDTRH
jgi:hypothetical protein